MPVHGVLQIMSNDSSESLFSYSTVTDTTMTVTETGVSFGTGESYVYTGNNKFIGLAMTSGAKEPDYAIGAVVDVASQSWVNYNIVEAEALIEISLTSPEGIRLCTKGTLCTKDIDVIPELQSKTVTPTTAQQTITPDNGNAGLSEVVIKAIPSEYEIPTYFEDSGITVADS